MSRSTTLIALGLIVLLAPFLGLYASWVAFIEAACGVVLVGFGLHARAMLARKSRETAPMMAEAPAAPPADEAPHLSAIA
jgi:ABC-type bacteriocin/lantibiotic exporter with double-glycine peptidase domain